MSRTQATKVHRKRWNHARLLIFHFFSTETWVDDEYFNQGTYHLNAKKDGQTVHVKYDFRTRYGEGEKFEFDADAEFLEMLDEIVKRYNLAQHNGYSYHVSGLPDMCGEELCIDYASGEYISASDNQNGFIQRACLLEICQLFCEKKPNDVE